MIITDLLLQDVHCSTSPLRDSVERCRGNPQFRRFTWFQLTDSWLCWLWCLHSAQKMLSDQPNEPNEPNEPNLYFFRLGIPPKHIRLKKRWSSLFRPFAFLGHPKSRIWFPRRFGTGSEGSTSKHGLQVEKNMPMRLIHPSSVLDLLPSA